MKLQRHSLETTTALERLRALEDASAFLQHELDVHRTFNGLPNSGGRASHQDSVQVQELTLALRRLSDKLSMTENSLLVRNEELVAMRKERDIAQRAKDLAYANSVRLRDELEELRAKEREWLNRVRMAEEERRVCPIFRSTPLQTYFLRLISDENRQLSDLVVEEYAELVRSLEGRSNSSFARNGTKENVNAVQTSLDGLMSARAGLQKLLEESNVDSENLHAEISRLHGALELAQISLGAEREISEDDKKKIALAQLELHRLEIDDNTAAKMVSRYMYAIESIFIAKANIRVTGNSRNLPQTFFITRWKVKSLDMLLRSPLFSSDCSSQRKGLHLRNSRLIACAKHSTKRQKMSPGKPTDDGGRWLCVLHYYDEKRLCLKG